ncbi:Minf_1886 family protein [Verrucomicrobium sp. 3C]|uniref:Minf_1886 family protein n=1 Tax=Verrucomicrobium sp. 3C TaxID=1134055 RepID=UPI00036C050E|nr:Minf_1886 family protein [Verrucomicrobium sp. 3C]
MRKRNFASIVEEICERDGRYVDEAYYFVREALHSNEKGGKRKGKRRMVTAASGKEILEALRTHALQEFGPMSKLVLSEWGIRNCGDLGDVILALASYGILGQTGAGTRKDFKNGFSFTSAFVKPFCPVGTVRAAGKRSASKTSRAKKKAPAA